MIKFKVALILVAVSVISFLFQNCGPGFNPSREDSIFNLENSHMLASAIELVDQNNLPRVTEQAKLNLSNIRPDWLSKMVFYQMRIERFTKEGTFVAAQAKLSALRDLGVTGIILNPVNEGYPDSNECYEVFYGIKDPRKIGQNFGGPEQFRAFVKEAHRLGMKVFMDIVPSGLAITSPLAVELAIEHQHANFFLPCPNDGKPCPKLQTPTQTYSLKGRDATAVSTGFMFEYNWQLPTVENFVTSFLVSFVKDYDVDGYRFDLEPGYAGPDAMGRIRWQIYKATGKKIMMMSESHQRGWSFDMAQVDTGLQDDNPERGEMISYTVPSRNGRLYDLVESLQGPLADYYNATATISNHDYYGSKTQGQILHFGYGSYLSPLQPHFFMSEEHGATTTRCGYGGNNGFRLYQGYFDSNIRQAQKEFREKVARLAQIRAMNSHLIMPPPGMTLGAFARERMKSFSVPGADLKGYSFTLNGESLVVVGKRTGARGSVQFSVEKVDVASNSYRVENLMTNEVYKVTAVNDSLSLQASLGAGELAVLKIVSDKGSVPPKVDPPPGSMPMPQLSKVPLVRVEANSELSGWPVKSVISGRGSVYSSVQYANASNPMGSSDSRPLFLAAWFSKNETIKEVVIYARVQNGKYYGIPRLFSFEIVNMSGDAWMTPAVSRTVYADRVVFKFPSLVVTSGIKITPSQLGVDPNGNYYLQIDEIEAYR